ncbi:MAG: hypothetical protein JW778_04320 [Candidatus Altiarchaeota archaeon]|nr:hypothetical protein [Candidatus Altiarchaeota archaeon]
MEKYAQKGLKKLFSLTKTKIRLAEEAGTVETRPAPLPIVKKLSGKEVKTVKEAKECREKLLETVDYSKPESIAETVFQLIDIIEGVKHRFEPPEYCALVNREDLEKIEKEKQPVNLLLMTEEAPEGVNVFIGEDSPKNALHLGRVPSTIAFFLDFAFESNYFSEGRRLKNINCMIGRKTLIADAIYYSLKEFGAG